MSVNHLDETHDILITTHNVWVKNVLTKKMVYKDTIPTLGTISQGVPGNADSTKIVSPKKDYEVYITVQ